MFLYFLIFEEWFDCRSRELFTLMSMKGFLKYCAKFISIYMLRWSDEEMYPNGWDTTSTYEALNYFSAKYVVDLIRPSYECIGFICYSMVLGN